MLIMLAVAYLILWKVFAHVSRPRWSVANAMLTVPLVAPKLMQLLSPAQ
jgi:hypothetical protein